MNNDQQGSIGRSAIISFGAVLLVGALFVVWIKGISSSGTSADVSPVPLPSKLTLPIRSHAVTADKSSASPKVPSGMPDWLTIRPGQILFTGTSSGLSNATSLFVCPTLSAYEDSEYGTDGGTAKCPTHHTGIPVRVISRSISHEPGEPDILQIRASDGSWSGYVSSMQEVQPKIPAGTLLRVANETARVPLGPSQDANTEVGVDLEPGAIVELIHQYPANLPKFYTLYVRVLNGKRAGKTGWLDVGEVETGDRLPLILGLSRTAGADQAQVSEPTPNLQAEASSKQAQRIPECDDFHQAVSHADAAAKTADMNDADALYALVVSYYDADEKYQSCLNATATDSKKYDVILADGRILIQEGLAFSLYVHAGGVYPSDPGGRNTQTLRDLAVKTLQLVANDDPAPSKDRHEARSLLNGIGE